MLKKSFTKKEVQRRLGLKEIKSPEQKIKKVEGMLKREESILSPETRNAAYSLLGDLYVGYVREKNRPEYIDSSSEEGTEVRRYLFSAAEAYAKAGAYRKAKNILNYRVGKFELDYEEGGGLSGLIATMLSNIYEMIFGGHRLKESNERRSHDITRFIATEKRKRERSKSGRGLEKIAGATVIIGLIGGLFFLSSNITGNAIGNLTQPTSNIIGGALFILGLIGAFFYFKSRK